jgi:uncharacterized protein (TIGR00290 family)
LKRALVSWSGGKDAAWSLHSMRGHYEIEALVTTVAECDGSVPVHNVPGRLIAQQAASLDLPLWTVPLPECCSNAEYSARLEPVWDRAEREGIEVVIFGDLFLADIRAWREQLLSTTRLNPVFPLWMEPARQLAKRMIAGGLRATICAVDERRLPAALKGRAFDEAFLSALPQSVDPCGENGEFHTFVTNMPGFNSEITECAASFL